MREALLKLVRMALRDGYLSDELLELIDITESNMKTKDSGKRIKYGDKKGGTIGRYPESGNKPTGPKIRGK